MAKYSVWVGGGEVNAHYLSKEKAQELADLYLSDGYDEVVIEKVSA
jgi:hypothetical protein